MEGVERPAADGVGEVGVEAGQRAEHSLSGALGEDGLGLCRCAATEGPGVMLLHGGVLCVRPKDYGPAPGGERGAGAWEHEKAGWSPDANSRQKEAQGGCAPGLLPTAALAIARPGVHGQPVDARHHLRQMGYTRNSTHPTSADQHRPVAKYANHAASRSTKYRPA